MYDNANALYAQTTAAHCDPNSFDPSSMYLYGTTFIRLLRGWLGGSYDIQWHETPGYAEEAAINDGSSDSTTPGYRYVTGGVRRANQTLNSYVCMYGQTSGYACGTLTSKQASLGWFDDPPYNAPASNATFMEVGITDYYAPQGGDSGAPVFRGNSALGTLSSGDDSGSTVWYMYYMPMDYVYSSDLTLVTR